MEELRRAGERGLPERDRSQSGASILASLVVVAMLGGVAMVADLAVSPEAQVAATGGSTASQTADQKAAAEKAALDKLIEQKCSELKPKASPGKPVPAVSTTPLEKGKQNIETSKCVSAFDLGTAQQPNKQCFGLVSKIQLNKDGTGKVISTPSQSVTKGKCLNEFWDGEGKKQLTSSEVGDLLKNLSPDQKAAIAENLGTTLDKATHDALTSALSGDALSIEDARAEKALQVSDAQQRLEELAKAGCNEQGAPCRPEEVAAAQDDLAKKQAELAALEEQQKRLRDAQVALQGFKPCAESDCQITQQKTETETARIEREYQQRLKQIDDDYRQRMAEIDRKYSTTGFQNPFGQQQPPPGNQSPRPPGTCSTGQTICSGNTLYSRNSQCVDTPVQYCPYGCAQQQQQTNTSGWSNLFGLFGGGQQTQSGQCAQTPQQCPQPPQQPNPANCQNGTWKPTYGPPQSGGQPYYGGTQQPYYGSTGNTCVVGWQCVPNTGEDPSQLTAQLSCQPKVADVGMTLAISYSCSAGTSEGSGFETGGAQSGNATSTVANPPGNTNTATYTLTCRNAGQTRSASCNVQVARPTIVLIANPAQVKSGKTSRLGWVTSGMQSCVIASPDLPDFTSQNANNTSVNGTAVTPALSSTAQFVLNCQTLGGNTRAASTTVRVL